MDKYSATKVPGYTSIDTLYEDCKRLIWSLCHKFAKKYNCDVEELYADAGMLFMRALKAYDADKGAPFHQVVRNHVWYGLFDAYRYRLMRNARVGWTHLSDMDDHVKWLEEMPCGRSFDCKYFKRSLSRDGALVVHLTITYPQDIGKALKRTEFLKTRKTPKLTEDQRDDILGEIRWFLMEWGWTIKRIDNAIKEVSDALKEQ